MVSQRLFATDEVMPVSMVYVSLLTGAPFTFVERAIVRLAVMMPPIGVLMSVALAGWPVGGVRFVTQHEDAVSGHVTPVEIGIGSAVTVEKVNVVALGSSGWKMLQLAEM